MSKKVIDTSKITNELEGASLFFNKPENDLLEVPGKPAEASTMPLERPKLSKVDKDTAVKITKQPRHHDTTVSRYHDDLIETIRKAVKTLGKEAATYRYTPEEKKALRDIIYTYEGQGVRTSENEIGRIAINNLIEDYHRNGAESVLARVLAQLNA